MVKISPRIMHVLHRTGECVSGYIDRKDMIAFQNTKSETMIKPKKNAMDTPIYYIQLDDGRYIGVISKCPIITVGLSILFLLGMVFSLN